MAVLRKKDGTPATWSAKPKGTPPNGGQYVQSGGKWLLKLPDTPASAPAPQQTTGPALPPRSLPGGPADFDFASMADPQAQNQIADLIANFKTATGGSVNPDGTFVPGETGGTLGSQFDALVKQLEARRPLVEQQKREGLQNVASQMAARGTIRSGLKEADDMGVRGQALNATDDIERGLQQAGTDRATALSEATSRYLQGKRNIETGAAADYEKDRMANFGDVFGGTPPPAPGGGEGLGAPGSSSAPPTPKTPPALGNVASGAPRMRLGEPMYANKLRRMGAQARAAQARATQSIPPLKGPTPVGKKNNRQVAH